MGAAEVQALQALSRDGAATEIMANADGSVYVERQGGRLEKLPLAVSEDDKIRFLEFLIGAKADLGPARPYADLTAQDGSRVHVLAPPLLGRGGLCITVRRRPERRPSLDDLIRLGALSPAAAGFLRYAVESRRNVLVAGGTSSGKTTLMNALASFIPPQERILVLEDTPEIVLPQPHALYLRTRMRDA
ncbi:MAG: CpaF family protein, partial [Elusimicrobia bacterium]|nr:CpaF family protein [Elusimicrobiota bacterium]